MVPFSNSTFSATPVGGQGVTLPNRKVKFGRFPVHFVREGIVAVSFTRDTHIAPCVKLRRMIRAWPESASDGRTATAPSKVSERALKNKERRSGGKFICHP